ncbi:DEAD/DEAH box helicase [Paramicrobacterium agarici]|uniref:Uncharacterized protein DUF1998 n=1 Tax=Paramicrobacterium agarici TaxID=630514 RepID=A0A2A9DU86_9MICO|nr:DEAD/DEAH box helicase [Microbacterium agarici]PFG29926.1 uncharacterized protein DUF1998 [Microbacterium agarici]
MSENELLPSRQAAEVRTALVEYITTTFALSDKETQGSLSRFLEDPDKGVFRGPFARVRLPFRAADPGWRDCLEWYEGFEPYGHQAHAFERLSSFNIGAEVDGEIKERPLPTVVTTGTGSGKTESFFYPILDHVLREKRVGRGGVKALILYPMNALANDQARRLAGMLSTHEDLAGIRAALYTGQKSSERTVMTDTELITKRSSIRSDPPDILLTNYKMLDQLLLRPEDHPLWEKSALSLRYLVLDEFHTYDGAQGTDVAMLLRRLGMSLKRSWPEQHPDLTDDVRERTLGLMTPVATSATLGDKGDPAAMLSFAQTVFGEPFAETAVVTETRLNADEWSRGADERLRERKFVPDEEVGNEFVSGIVSALDGVTTPETIALEMLGWLYRERIPHPETGISEPVPRRDIDLSDTALILDLIKRHPFVHSLIEEATVAVSLDDLADRVLPRGLLADETPEGRTLQRREFITLVLAMLSHVRYLVGNQALSIDVHLWTRALSRLDRVAGPTASFRWTDDGGVDIFDNDDPFSDEGREAFPAIYCRHCGRSGWGIELAPTGKDLATTDTDIRRNHASKDNNRFRPLIFAPAEADLVESTDVEVPGLAWFYISERALSSQVPEENSVDIENGTALPVLTHLGDDAGDASHDDTCPSCGRVNSIRFMGSAIATMLSVSITSLFGEADLDAAEKKALVFTDSVQDAAHRAGFVQSRAHVFGFRNAIYQAVGEGARSLDDVVEALLRGAEGDAHKRYRLLAPEIADHEKFAEFWKNPSSTANRLLARVKERLRLDVALEFGLQSRTGRTLELTGTLAAQVDAGEPMLLENIGRRVLTGYERQEMLGEDAPDVVDSSVIVMWVRGVLERMRDRGAIEHDWFKRYVENDGKRYWVWGGRKRNVGMPAFPAGRDAPGYPRVGNQAPGGTDNKRTHLDVVTSAQSWFAIWARDVLKVSAADGARMSRMLLTELERADIVTSVPIVSGGATAYQLSMRSVTVQRITESERKAGSVLLVCGVCRNPVPGTPEVVTQLDGAPCFAARCPGTLHSAETGGDFYRKLYSEGDVRKVVAREHTSLLEDKVRLEYETEFKESDSTPNAPNVLVATPTLEMGIDIGDLSTVMLAGIPRTVASYLQRVGRAGRLTGNALSLAFVNGRGEQLPKIGDPLSVINGQVRPPATYLNAEEILRRQYIASIIDRGVADGPEPPRQAQALFASTEPGSFLGDLIDRAEANHASYLTEFLSGFSELAPEVETGLRDWATPRDNVRSSGLARDVLDASMRWNDEYSALNFRRDEVERSLAGLEKEANSPANKGNDTYQLDLNSAQASARLLGRLMKDMATDPWVSTLERYGLLPNYTLFDDSVELDVMLNWIDPDTGEYQNDGQNYGRQASIALHELAPGATFYAQGLEVNVDAVDLGVDASAVRSWAFCPACGYGLDVELTPMPATCPRCGAEGLNDVAQRMNVVELTKVSAEVRRDEASIGDSRDERVKERFAVRLMADIDPASVENPWFVTQNDFGIKPLRSVDIRWLNLGKQTVFGSPRMLSGEETIAPLFRVCRHCGKLDSSANANTNREHRPWCPQRKKPDEDVVSIALSRTLTTQGVVMRLPAQLTLGDSLAVPSFVAAFLLGLRERIGGDPDHIRVERITDPFLSDGSENTQALLIHDTVPGGTGYLAEIADPDSIRDILMRALDIVRDCDCQNEGRRACHHCVLPYAPSTALDRVARTSAQNALEAVLLIGPEREAQEWEITREQPKAQDPPLESKFRKVFIERATSLGAAVSETPTDRGNKVSVTFPASGRKWVLEPQVQVKNTVPDFVLQQHGGGALPIAIYTDGRAFHASVTHNRIADDAQKRRMLRGLGYLVMGVTWDDADRAETGEEISEAWWFSESFARQIAPAFELPASQLPGVFANPLTRLMEWMQDPDGSRERWVKLAEALPLLTMSPGGQQVIDESGSARQLAVRAVTGDLQPAPQSAAWVVQKGALTLSGVLKDGSGHSEVVLALDDSDDAFASEGFAREWKLWLHWSNILGARNDGEKSLEIVATSELGTPQSSAVAASIPHDVSSEWASTFEVASDDERVLLEELSVVHDMIVPEVGIEVGDGIPVGIAWPGRKLAIDSDLDEQSRLELRDLGWTIVSADPDAIVRALESELG